MARTEYETARRAIRDHVDTLIGDDTNLRRLINVAAYDLHFGPTGAYEPDGDGWIYPGFEAATDTIRDSILADIGTLYYLPDCDIVTDTEPEGWEDDGGAWYEPDPYYTFDPADVLRAYLGKLAEYL